MQKKIFHCLITRKKPIICTPPPSTPPSRASREPPAPWALKSSRKRSPRQWICMKALLAGRAFVRGSVLLRIAETGVIIWRRDVAPRSTVAQVSKQHGRRSLFWIRAERPSLWHPTCGLCWSRILSSVHLQSEHSASRLRLSCASRASR